MYFIYDSHKYIDAFDLKIEGVMVVSKTNIKESLDEKGSIISF